MFRHAAIRNLALALAVTIVLLAGCTAAQTTPSNASPTTQPTTTPTNAPATQPTTVPSTAPATQPTMTPTPVPTAQPTTTPTTAPTTSPTTSPSVKPPFQIDVLPKQLKGFSIPGQRVVFLVTIAEASRADGETVIVSAAAKNATVTIEHKSIMKNQVAEVTVIPSSGSAGKSVDVTITGTKGALTAQQAVAFDVITGKDDRKSVAVALRNKFVAWLAEKKPELKINSKTQWTGTMVSPQWLVVSHYLFFSDEWEMHVDWHIMIAPSDWARIDLRHRFDETKPSYAFEISSRAANSEPKAMDVPGEIWR